MVDPPCESLQPSFDQEQDWPRWCFAFESYAGLLSHNLQTVMERAVEMATERTCLSTYRAVAASRELCLQSTSHLNFKVVPSTS